VLIDWDKLAYPYLDSETPVLDAVLQRRSKQQRHLLDAEHRRYPPRLRHDGAADVRNIRYLRLRRFSEYTAYAGRGPRGAEGAV
jgi:hypothetical protein